MPIRGIICTIEYNQGLIKRKAIYIPYAQARGTLTKHETIADEIDVAEQSPRIGVFGCCCGINIAASVDVVGDSAGVYGAAWIGV